MTMGELSDSRAGGGLTAVRRVLRAPLAAVAAYFALGGAVIETAHSADLHRLWDDRCIECHGHAAEFARQRLSVDADGRLQGGHPARDMKLFLSNHFLPLQDVDAVYAMLLAQAQTTPKFKQTCGGCHQSAAQFARDSLFLRSGVLYGRRSGQPVEAFLQDHRNLSGADAAFFAALLTRVANEVGVESE